MLAFCFYGFSACQLTTDFPIPSLYVRVTASVVFATR